MCKERSTIQTHTAHNHRADVRDSRRITFYAPGWKRGSWVEAGRASIAHGKVVNLREVAIPREALIKLVTAIERNV